MQMKTTVADDCFPLDSLGALLPFSVLHNTTPTTGAPLASEFHHLVSSFSFVSTHTHTTSYPQLHFSTGHILVHFLQAFMQVLSTQQKHGPTGAPAIRKHGLFEPQEKHDPGVSEDVYLGARLMLVLLSKTPIQTTIHIIMVGTSI